MKSSRFLHYTTPGALNGVVTTPFLSRVSVWPVGCHVRVVAALVGTQISTRRGWHDRHGIHTSTPAMHSSQHALLRHGDSTSSWHGWRSSILNGIKHFIQKCPHINFSSIYNLLGRLGPARRLWDAESSVKGKEISKFNGKFTTNKPSGSSMIDHRFNLQVANDKNPTDRKQYIKHPKAGSQPGFL